MGAPDFPVAFFGECYRVPSTVEVCGILIVCRVCGDRSFSGATFWSHALIDSVRNALGSIP